MKDTYLRNLGFVPVVPSYSLYRTDRSGEAAYIPPTDARYQHIYAAQDGSALFVYSWLHEPGYMLTSCENVTAMSDIIAELDSDDPTALVEQMQAFFRDHGGIALSALENAPFGFSAPAREQAA